MSTFLNVDAPDQEQNEKLKKAITAALRWFAQTKSKRQGDDCHAVTLIDLLEDLDAE